MVHPFGYENNHVRSKGWVMGTDVRSLADVLILCEQLRQEIQSLRGVIAELEKRIADLVVENKTLRDQLDDAQRQAARQAAPFRRRDAKKVPEDRRKSPGRPKGHPGVYRPVPEEVDEQIDVPLTGCPTCGGTVADLETIEQYIEDLPPVRPWVTRLVTYRGQCSQCGEVQSLHPLKTSAATGAAKTQLGPRAQALAVTLNKQHGLTMRTTCRVLRQIAGLTLSPGGLAQVLQRVARKAQDSYDALVTDLRRSAAVFVDETSWYVGEPGHWLWVFTTDTTTVYQVDKSRGRNVVTETLGSAFTGVLVSDCLAAYDNLPYRTHKCIAHHLKAIKEARERPDTKDPSYLDQWKLLFQAVIGYWRARSKMDATEYAERRGHLKTWMDRLLEEKRTQPGDLAVQNRIKKRRDHILVCLDDPAVEPTNNRAEQALRPAVIARKLSCGNKTEAGKMSFEVLASVTTTCLKRGHDAVSYLAELLPLGTRASPVPAAQ